MIINPVLKAALDAIAQASIRYHNNPALHDRYIKRILKVYDQHLSQEERVYVFYSLLELVHYRNLAVDPDNMITISNVRIRTLFFVFVATIIAMVLAAVLFKPDSAVGNVLPLIMNFFKMVAI